ncbi:calcium-binding protein SPEC 2A-like [Mercenaria mercenaria]|uniref:calcium-binding protein SPEC 2A-like n=1 Tax=Mercenaria mercenaria TaxID=6596 RepID=UPI001E1D9E80|nr:calcium-binding protein SPEC 2A-like [Mercenaria mercenaria]XP_045169844.1 calcium-binding protein SPEC 2A-like [Mercenaria mercenaria]
MSLTMQQIEDFWRVADTDNSGDLTIQELAVAIRKYSRDVSDAEIAGMFCAVDKDESKRMSKREFIAEMNERQKRAVAMEKLFKQYDKDGSKTLSRGELIEMIRSCFPEDQANYVVGKFLCYCDNGDGIITFGEFKKFFG